tara:strand:+ start:352 stop:1608 length:1257 start_codon:yes stop_codon:yes gene_type:complete
MMSRTLKRPMFRMGGSSGTGITSGLDRPGYKRAGQVTGQRIFDATNPEGVFRTTASEMLAANKLRNAPQETAFNVESDAQSRIDLANKFAPRAATPFGPGSLSGFLTSTGLNLLSATPRGNIFATAAGAAKEPFDAFTAAKGTEAAEDRALALASLREATTRGETLADTAAALEAKKEQTQALIDADIELENLEHANEIKEIEKEAELEGPDSTTYAKKQAADAYKATFAPDLKNLDNLIASTTGEQKKEYEQQKSALINKIIEGQQSIYLGKKTNDEFARDVIIKVLEGFKAGGELEDQQGITAAFNAIATFYPNYKELLGPNFVLPEAKAEGGRIGYKEGSFTAPTASVQTTASQTQDLTFTELRSRLPNSIGDDIVTVLSNSKQALLDFANIRDQRDVEEFNQRYNLNLTIPQEG